MRTPFAVMAVLLVALLGLWFATEDESEQAPAPAAAPVDVIASRVEALRHLRFEQLPEPLEVSAEQARREGLESLDREYPAERRRADESVYKLLGLIEPDADLRELGGDLFGEGVAGYYDPRDGRLRVVEGAGSGRVLEEMILAHELTHALEDQRFGLETEPSTDDRTLARSALYEGTATALMYAYVGEHFSTEETLGGLLSSAFEDTGDLPPFIQAQVLFAYVGGEAFIREVLRRGGWRLVDTAYEVRRPSSTEQILHPDAYFEADEPKPVRMRAGPVLGAGWQRALRGTWGELQTRELLGGSSRAAAGWGGDRYELWRSGDDEALIMRWRWDTPRDEAEFDARLRDVLGDRGVVARRGGTVTLALAPDRDLAERLAGA
jgi:hypothetical protein